MEAYLDTCLFHMPHGLCPPPKWVNQAPVLICNIREIMVITFPSVTVQLEVTVIANFLGYGQP